MNKQMKDLLVIDRNTGEELADLFTTKAEITRTLNQEFVLTFTAFKQELKTQYLKDGSIIADNQTFDIVLMEKDHRDGGAVVFNCEANHVFMRLHYPSTKRLNYAYFGTPKQILTDILNGSEFTAGQVDFTDTITFAINQEATTCQLVLALVSVLGGEVEYTNKGFTINILNTIGQNNGFEIALGKNLIGVKEIYDVRDGEGLTSYQVDLLELKNSKEYIEKGYSELEVIGLGDTVLIYDEEAEIEVEQRILSMTYDPRYKKNTTVQIASTIEFFTDDAIKVESQTVFKEKLYYGIKISPNIGFECERSDLLAKTTLNADTFKMQTGDGTGAYIDSLWFDPIAKVYKFTGRLEATEIVGGSITIGNNFSVDTDGNMIANDAEFTGAVKGGTIEIGNNFSVDILGNMKARNAEFEGAVKGGTIAIGTKFSVDSFGNMKAIDAEFEGDIKGGTIEIGTGFSVDNNGKMKAVDGEFEGDITGASNINVTEDVTIGKNLILTPDEASEIKLGAQGKITFDNIGGVIDIVAPNLTYNYKRILTEDDLPNLR